MDNNHYNTEDELSKLLDEIKQKRENPDAISFATIEQEIIQDRTAEITAQRNALVSNQKREVYIPGEPIIRSKVADKPNKKKKEQKRASFSKRHIIGALHAGEEEESFTDPINKNMLAPTIERGIDDVDLEDELIAPVGEEEKTETIQKMEYTQNHPIFTQTYTRSDIPVQTTTTPEQKKSFSTQEQHHFVRPSQSTVPLPASQHNRTVTQELPQNLLQKPVSQQERNLTTNTQSRAFTASFTPPNTSHNHILDDQMTGHLFTTAEIRMTDLSQAAPKKRGVLNLQDNLDENFREFFSDTVIVDQPSSKHRFREEEEDDVLAMPGERRRPTSRAVVENSEEIRLSLSKQRTRTFMRLVFTGFFSICLLTISILAQLGFLPSAVGDNTVYYALCGILLLFCIAVNIVQIINGLLQLFTFRATGESLPAFAVLLAVLECILQFLKGGETPQPLYGSVATLTLFFAALGTLFSVNRVFSGYSDVTESYDKFVSNILNDNKFSRRLVREVDAGNTRVLLKRRAGRIDDFMSHAFSASQYVKKISIVMSISVLVSIACAVYTFYAQRDLTIAVISACVSAVLSAPFTCTIAETLPISKMHWKISRVGAVLPGYSAADEICSANCVVLEGRELFPQGNVLLHGIKTFERERIDKAILYAASVIIQSCDTMAHMFMSVIQNKTEMLYEIDSVEFEAALGYSFWIEKERILLGTRELLRSHDIEVPSRDYENRYTKTSTRDAIYLAVAGKLYAMFVVSYSPNADVYDTLHGFVEEGINILIHTRDFNLTPSRISRFYNIPQNMISVIRENDSMELSRHTEFTGHSKSLLTHIGSLSSFTRGVVGAYNLRSAVKTSSILEFISIIFGLLLSVAFVVIGAVGSIGVLEVFAFQIIWFLILYASVSLHRY